jgi:glycosyltransferase involved in cell wall biosynthesis
MALRPRILFLSASSGLYGAERCLLELLKGLPHEKYEIFVLLSREGPLKKEVESLGLTTIISKLKWIGGDGRWLEGIIGLPRRLSKLIKIIDENRIDLVYSNTSVILDGAIAAKIRGIPHIWHVHEGMHQGGMGLIKRIIRSFLITSLSEKVIVLTRGLKKYFSLFGNWKIYTIYNGIDVKSLDRHITEKSRFQEELNLKENYPIVALVGSFLENKGQIDLVEAAHLINKEGMKVYYLLVGDGNLEYIDKVKERIETRGLSNFFRLTGFRSDIAYILRNIDLFVLASRREPFGRVILEAMACWKPVVATKSGGPEEIVIDGVTGVLVPPQSPQDLAVAIMRIMGLRDGGEEMGRLGRKRVEAYFSLKTYQNRITETIEEALSRTHERLKYKSCV